MAEERTDFPEIIRQSSRSDAATYTLSRDFIALEGVILDDTRDDVAYTFKGEGISVVRIGINAIERELHILPVYMSHSQWMVATGLVFVRFKEGVSAKSYEPAINKAAYVIDSIPGYAPHTAWLKNQSDDIGVSLHNIAKLAALPDLVHAEPQLLAAKTSRTPQAL
jgi:hypothetical protein